MFDKSKSAIVDENKPPVCDERTLFEGREEVDLL